MALAVAVVLTVAACSGTASSRAAPTSSLAETVPSPPATDPVTTTSSTVPVTVSTSSTTGVPASTAAPPEMTLPAAKAHPLGTYTDWQWALIPPGAWYTDQELNLSVVTDPGPGTPFFFAHMVGFVHGLGGYIGLQTLAATGPGPNAPAGKAAIFSLFGACDDNAPTAGCPGVAGGNALPTPGNGSFCVPLTDANGHAPEGSGSSCRIAFNWLAGDAYRLRVTAGGPHTWLGSVVDMATGTVTAIGRIRVPDSWQGLASSSVSWIEYYGDQAKLASCRDIPPASARWDAGGGTQLVPGAGLLGAGAISVPAAPTSIHDHVGVGIDLCANSSIVDLPYPALGSVQTMGG